MAAGLWKGGERDRAVKLLQAAREFPENQSELIATTRQLGQLLLWNGDEESGRQYFESVLETVESAEKLGAGDCLEAYSAAIQLESSWKSPAEASQGLTHFEFLLEHRADLDPQFTAECLQHKAALLIRLGRASEACAIFASESTTLLRGDAGRRVDVARTAIMAMQNDPTQHGATAFLGEVWADPIARTSPDISLVGWAWVQQLAAGGDRTQAQHAAIEVFRVLDHQVAELGVLAAPSSSQGAPTSFARALKDRRDALISFLQSADAQGLPEYALEANMALAEHSPTGSTQHTDAVREIERLSRLIAAKTPAPDSGP